MITTKSSTMEQQQQEEEIEEVEVESRRNLKRLKKLVNPWNWYPQTWNKAFVATCVLGVIFDPLFLYVPTINSGEKCLAVDDPMNVVALTLRAVTDVVSVVHVCLRFQSARKMAGQLGLSFFSGVPWSNLVVNVLAILPIPQVAMVKYFTKLAGTESLSARKLLNSLLTLQYVPRLVRLYLAAKEVGAKAGLNSLVRRVWVRGAFFFIHYLIFGHILGALWYFYAIFRETACWHAACKKLPGCDESMAFDCELAKPIGNMTYLNDFCPVDPPNPAVFDFGIFSDAVKSGILRETGFPTKLSRSFWWGLSNLSSFGQNLETTSNVYENLFAVLISILGLLLFLYLIGNLQTYMQLATTKSEEARRKINVKLPEIDSFLTNHNLPPHKKKLVVQYLEYTIKHDKDFDIKRLLALLQERHEHSQNDGESFSTWVNKILDTKRHDRNTSEVKAMFWIADNEIGAVEKKKILQYVRLRLNEGNDIDFKNLLPILPSDLGLSIKNFLCFPILKKVPMLENLDEEVYETICRCAKPAIYAEKTYVIRKDEPVDFLLLVTQGILLSFGNGEITKRIQRGEFWGVEMLKWRLRTGLYLDFPISKSNLKCHKKVEGFTLMAADLNQVLSKWWAKFPMSEGLKPFAEASLEKGLRRYIRNRRDRVNRNNCNNNQLCIVTSST